MIPETDSSYWDKVSVEASESVDNSGDTIRELLRDAFENVTEPLLRELFSIEADVIYLNLICEYPQSGIGKLYGMSQMGVSKRVDRGMRKLKVILGKPSSDLEEIKTDLQNMTNLQNSDYLLLYYKFTTYAYITTLLVETSKTKVPKYVLEGLDDLEKFASGNFKHLFDDDSKNAYLSKLEDPEFCAKETAKAKEYIAYFNVLIDTFSYGDVQFKARVKKLYRHHMLDCV